MMAVWVLATPDIFRSTAVKFGVSRGIVFHHYTHLIKGLSEMSAVYVKWPGPVERDVIKFAFEDRHGYPGCEFPFPWRFRTV